MIRVFTIQRCRVIRIGDKAALKHKFTQNDVKTFSQLCGDHNPIHLQREAAVTAGFPNCLCHGALVGSLFSTIMGTDLPGPASVYLYQTFQFVAPVFVGDEVEATVIVKEFMKSKGLIRLNTTVSKRGPEGDVLCISGEAVGMNKTVTFDGESAWTFVRSK